MSNVKFTPIPVKVVEGSFSPKLISYYLFVDILKMLHLLNIIYYTLKI